MGSGSFRSSQVSETETLRDGQIRLYKPTAEGRWSISPIDDDNVAYEDIKLADLNADGRLDIVASAEAPRMLSSIGITSFSQPIESRNLAMYPVNKAISLTEALTGRDLRERSNGSTS